jgi:hypothetical protein
MLKNSIETSEPHKKTKIFKIVKTERKKNQPVTEEFEEEEIKTNPNSLINISREVYKYLESNNKTKGNNVTQYILEQLNISQDDMSFKNIQRRVYDAINVMHAIGLLDKEKNVLYYKGDTNFKNKFVANSSKKHNNVLKDKINQKASIINRKQHELMALYCKVNISHISSI